MVFLLFMIGLELSFERLTRLRALVFGLGALQIGACAAALGAIAVFAFGLTRSAGLVIGCALALSSTAIVIPTLVERRRLGTAAGRAAFAVLLAQDLMVAPMLFMVSMLGARGAGLGGGLNEALLFAILPAAAALALIVGAGRLLLRPLFHQVAHAHSTEFFMAACLLVVMGTAIVSAMAGLSMALGAFIAGLLLAETEYRREVEVTIEPFKGLLLGLFFVSVGAGLDIGAVIAAPLFTLGLAFGLIAVKSAIVFALALALRLRLAVAREIALLLGPGGEFAFALIGAGVAQGLVGAEIGAHLMVAVTLSMVAIPALAALAARVPHARVGQTTPIWPASNHPATTRGASSSSVMAGSASWSATCWTATTSRLSPSMARRAWCAATATRARISIGAMQRGSNSCANATSPTPPPWSSRSTPRMPASAWWNWPARSGPI